MIPIIYGWLSSQGTEALLLWAEIAMCRPNGRIAHHAIVALMVKDQPRGQFDGRLSRFSQSFLVNDVRLQGQSRTVPECSYRVDRSFPDLSGTPKHDPAVIASTGRYRTTQ